MAQVRPVVLVRPMVHGWDDGGCKTDDTIDETDGSDRVYQHGGFSIGSSLL